jgi:trans-aconitate methyltransferase
MNNLHHHPQGHPDFWDPQFYRQSSQVQEGWGRALIDKTRYCIKGAVLDVGSGDGYLTSDLLLIPGVTSVTGLDISKKMTEYAHSHYAREDKKLQFVECDAREMNYEEEFHTIFSNAAFQRITNKKLLLEKCFNALKPHGHLVSGFPAFGSPLLTRCIGEVVRPGTEWNEYFNGVPDQKKFDNTQEGFTKNLEEVGFVVQEVSVKWKDEIIPSKLDFRNFLETTYTYKYKIPKHRQEAFFDEIVNKYIGNIPIDEQGRVHFYFSSLQVIAYKPVK